MNHHSNIYRALAVNPGSAIVHDRETIYSRDLEVPSGGGVGTARAIAKVYGEFATGGNELGLRRETLDELAAPAIPPTTAPNPFFLLITAPATAPVTPPIMAPCVALFIPVFF